MVEVEFKGATPPGTAVPLPVGESLVVDASGNERITITVLEAADGRVRIGIAAPRSLPISRGDLAVVEEPGPAVQPPAPLVARIPWWGWLRGMAVMVYEVFANPWGTSVIDMTNGRLLGRK